MSILKRLYNYYLLIFLVLLLAKITDAQVTQEWLRTYGPSNSNGNGTCIKVDAAGNSYAGGSLSASGNANACIMKYNSAGVQQWAQNYNGPGNAYDLISALAIDASGNVYGAGISSGVTSGNDFLAIKYNSSGVLQWAATYNDTASAIDIAKAIAVDASGNVFVTGYSYYLSSANSDYVTVKYNSAGVQQWAVKFDGTGHQGDGAYAIAVDASGNVFVTGGSISSSNGSDIVTVKYNTSGVQLWSASYDGPAHLEDGAYNIGVDASGNIIIGGYSIGSGSSYDDVVIKYGTGGSQLWTQRYNGPGNGTDYIFGLAIANSGDIFVTGMSEGSGTTQDFCTIKYDQSGNQQWTARFNGTGNVSDWAYGIVLDDNENSYVAGYSDSTATGHNCCTVKYNSAGVQQWVQKYGTPGDDRLAAIGIDASSNVYVEGYALVSTASNFITIKYAQPSGIEQISGQVPSEFSLSQNYPNPFNPATNFEFRIANFGLVNITIYDVQGKLVSTILNEELKPGTYKADFDGTKFASGVYFYKLETNNFIETKKMLMIK